MSDKTDKPRCQVCGYTKEDAIQHGDHHLCINHPNMKDLFRVKPKDAPADKPLAERCYGTVFVSFDKARQVTPDDWEKVRCVESFDVSSTLADVWRWLRGHDRSLMSVTVTFQVRVPK